ncbi:hypothetical protein LSH36_193g13045 [Paralvinella palmiformis]|uniref:Uncharacterized protein n=1 Tax=Paralvinella palmiformis TaxID=53620 RepID=A0AAD9JQ82_9ANNE|nr:hypothetical protein LSH36_193g13045 [Paralvinella palmiformis]
MTHTQWNGTDERHRAMTSTNRDRKLRGHVVHRTVIPIIDGRTYDVVRGKPAHAGSTGLDSQSDRRKQVTYLPLQHVQSSLPSLFRPGKGVEVTSPGHGSLDIGQRSLSGLNRQRYFFNNSKDPEIGSITQLLRTATLREESYSEHGVDNSGTETNPAKTVIYYKPNQLSRQNTPTIARVNDRCCRHMTRQQADPERTDFRELRAKSLPVAINPILKRQPEPDKSVRTVNQGKGHRRRACFKQEVDICYFNAKDRPRTTIAMPRRSQNLSCGAYIVDPEEKAKDAIQNSQRAEDELTTPVIPPDQPLPCLYGQTDPERGIACSTDVTFIPCIDGKGNKGRLLRLNIRANVNCVRERTLVKALSGGGALIVHLFQNEAQDGGSAILRRHVKKMSLPVNIDPYRVRAHVHKDGQLTIEAPVMDCVLPNI